MLCMVVVLHLGLAASRRANRELDFDRSRLFEGQGRLDGFALLERLLHVHEHDVIAAGFQLDDFAFGNRDPALQFAHDHDAAIDLHLVELDRRCPV
ncbi:hypothetical protein D9M68_708150 [compost metagenome]